MHTSSLTEIKKELNHLSREELVALCVRLAKFKKINKELLHYLLFESAFEEDYVVAIKDEMSEAFAELNTATVYTTKKGVQKILRNVKKYIRYSGKKETEIALLLFFCKKMVEYRVRINYSSVLYNLYARQVEAARKALEKLHEDLRFDYIEELEQAEAVIR